MTSFVNAKKQVAGNGEFKDHYFLHEQRKEKRLQQLQKHTPHEHPQPSICSNYLAQTAEASYVSILRITELLPLRNVNGRYDFLPLTISEEMHIFHDII